MLDTLSNLRYAVNNAGHLSRISRDSNLLKELLASLTAYISSNIILYALQLFQRFIKITLICFTCTHISIKGKERQRKSGGGGGGREKERQRGKERENSNNYTGAREF